MLLYKKLLLMTFGTTLVVQVRYLFRPFMVIVVLAQKEGNRYTVGFRAWSFSALCKSMYNIST